MYQWIKVSEHMPLESVILYRTPQDDEGQGYVVLYGYQDGKYYSSGYWCRPSDTIEHCGWIYDDCSCPYTLDPDGHYIVLVEAE